MRLIQSSHERGSLMKMSSPARVRVCFEELSIIARPLL